MNISHVNFDEVARVLSDAFQRTGYFGDDLISDQDVIAASNASPGHVNLEWDDKFQLRYDSDLVHFNVFFNGIMVCCCSLNEANRWRVHYFSNRREQEIFDHLKRIRKTETRSGILNI